MKGVRYQQAKYWNVVGKLRTSTNAGQVYPGCSSSNDRIVAMHRRKREATCRNLKLLICEIWMRCSFTIESRAFCEYHLCIKNCRTAIGSVNPVFRLGWLFSNFHTLCIKKHPAHVVSDFGVKITNLFFFVRYTCQSTPFKPREAAKHCIHYHTLHYQVQPQPKPKGSYPRFLGDINFI